MVCVLMVASGAGWEPAALGLLNERAGIVVLKRCVDVNDLLASAGAGQADVAVLALDAPGLDGPAVEHLHRHRVRPIAIVPDDGPSALAASRLRASRIGLGSLVAVGDLASLPEVVATVEDEPGPAAEAPPSVTPGEPAVRGGRVVAVWGPHGAPGRTTLAGGLAAELARRRLRTVLVDADPYGGAVAQQWGVLDEVSGLLSAARLATSGGLVERFTSIQRAVGENLSVITGLPRADRWVEVRAEAVEQLLGAGRERGHVVVDTGFSLEDDPGSDFGSRPGRNAMTLAAIGVADEIVVVGGADPVGLSRLARGLVELRDVTGGVPVRVVVNRMRSSLGWAERDIAGMVEGFARISGLHFLPEDRATVDRAVVAGHSIIETRDSALARGVASLVDALAPASALAADRRSPLRRRRAGRARPR